MTYREQQGFCTALVGLTLLAGCNESSACQTVSCLNSPAIPESLRIALLIVCLTALGLATTQASELSIPKKFANGERADADDVNANFTAVKTSVDDNSRRLDALAEVASRTISVDTSMPRPEIQGLIDGINKHIPYGVSVTLQFADGTYALNQALSFGGFYGGGALEVLGAEIGVPTPYTGQAVILSFVDAGSSGLSFEKSTVSIIVRNIHIVTDASVDRIAGIRFFSVPTLAHVQSCFLEGVSPLLFGDQSAGVMSSFGSNVLVESTLFSGSDIGIYAVFSSRVYSRSNDDTGDNLPNYGQTAHGSVIHQDASPISGAIADFRLLGGGVIHENP